MDKQLNKTKWCAYLQSFCGFQAFFGTVMVIFYTTYMHLTYSQYLMIDSLLFGMIALFELPSGYLSDKLGRKKMILLARIFEIFAMSILVLIPSFTGAFISCIIMGIFAAMESGNEDALYYEVYSTNGKEREFKAVMGHVSTISLICSTVFSVISGYVAEVNLAIPVIIDIVLLTISTIGLGFLLHDDESYKQNASFSLTKDFKNNKEEILHIVPYFLFFGIIFSLFRVSYSMYQPLLNELSIPLKYFGYFFALCNFIGSLGSSLYAKNIFKQKQIPYIIFIFYFITLVGILLVSNQIGLVFLLAQQILRGIALPYLRVETQQIIPQGSTLRVTYGSIQSLCSKLTVSIFTWIYSLVIVSSISVSMFIMGTIMLGMYIIVYFGIQKREKLIEVKG